MLNIFISSFSFWGKMLRKVDTIKDVYNCIDRKKRSGDSPLRFYL